MQKMMIWGNPPLSIGKTNFVEIFVVLSRFCHLFLTLTMLLYYP